jgi:hypothetical protein
MMTRRLALVLAGAFSVSLVSILMAGPAQAVCRPNCLDTKKHAQVRDMDRGERWERGEHGDRGKHHHYGWAKHKLHKHHGRHRGHGGHDEPPVTPPPVTQPPVTPPPVEPPPPSSPPPCIGC